MKKNNQVNKLPRHIAVIMDGNGRWAKQRHLPRVMGHHAGMKPVREIVEGCVDLGIEVLTLYAFSTENWSRPSTEVSALMRLLRDYLRKEIRELKEKGVRLQAIGRREGLPSLVQKELDLAEKETKENKKLILNLALNYGGRQEIVDAVNKILQSSHSHKIDEKKIEDYLYTAGLPDPDLLIRTSGEYRISNFLLWQIAYTEIFVTPALWPDFGKKDFIEIISAY
ncbi:MAG: isoprenyl transferase [Elusimicrobiota bacterium]